MIKMGTVGHVRTWSSILLLVLVLTWQPVVLAQLPQVQIAVQNEAPAGAIVVNGAVVNQQGDEQKQLQREIHRELCFLRRAIILSDEQDQALSSFDITKLDELRLQQRKVAPGINFNANAGQVRIVVNAIDPLRIRQAQRAFEKEVDAILTEEQKRMYAEEKRLRDEFYVDTTALGCIILLSRHLSLDEQQRIAILQSLKEWPGISSLDLTQYHNAPQYLPNLPEHELSKHLNPDQKAVFSSLPRIDLHNQFGMRQQLMGDIEVKR